MESANGVAIPSIQILINYTKSLVKTSLLTIITRFAGYDEISFIDETNPNTRKTFDRYYTIARLITLFLPIGIDQCHS